MSNEILLIFFVCIVGVGYSSYKIGIKEGSESMLGLLEKLGVITMDNFGNIMPNKDYTPTKRKI
jgi:hypothetical protein